MSHLAVIIGSLAVCILAGISGYIGWYLSHRSYLKGFKLGCETGYRACQEDNKKPTLRGL